jgi:mono/diheme cytochrome c family protein
MNRPRSFLVWLGIAALLAAPRRAAAQTTTPAADSGGRMGAFTAEQAARGEQVFRTVCAGCHVASQFANAPFRRAWAGRQARELFEVIRTTMPQDNPGRLRRAQYADVVAYVLHLNGAVPGNAELPPDSVALARVVFPQPEPRSP